MAPYRSSIVNPRSFRTNFGFDAESTPHLEVDGKKYTEKGFEGLQVEIAVSSD